KTPQSYGRSCGHRSASGTQRNGYRPLVRLSMRPFRKRRLPAYLSRPSPEPLASRDRRYRSLSVSHVPKLRKLTCCSPLASVLIETRSLFLAEASPALMASSSVYEMRFGRQPARTIPTAG